ncbi:hypothetical protein [Francisella philomiragia]|uniref:Uncharacterized protein n=1 Tax=Francisella philomiragia TaxID=28110 RepID=A0ABS1GEU0_9GAMM|nr:hypothetical protein [Francisella philomiragia]MBK2259580.1 hypothetical protein [Francisella philomiragia]MBK2303272.1 hypothetical protein [Francisella philomiragia]
MHNSEIITYINENINDVEITTKREFFKYLDQKSFFLKADKKYAIIKKFGNRHRFLVFRNFCEKLTLAINAIELIIIFYPNNQPPVVLTGIDTSSLKRYMPRFHESLVDTLLDIYIYSHFGELETVEIDL